MESRAIPLWDSSLAAAWSCDTRGPDLLRFDWDFSRKYVNARQIDMWIENQLMLWGGGIALR